VSNNVAANRQPPADSSTELPLQIRFLQPSFRILARNWWASLVWLGVIRLESTEAASSTNTFSLLNTVLSFLFGHTGGLLAVEINYFGRKAGHFMGYGILGVLVFLALRNTNRDRLSALLPRRWGSRLYDLWRMQWVWLGIGVAVITAALDEIHQTFLPSRSGRWQDVVLDTCGAAVLQVVLYFFSLWALNRTRKRLAKPVFSSSQ
jgi:VanZ family protein